MFNDSLYNNNLSITLVHQRKERIIQYNFRQNFDLNVILCIFFQLLFCLHNVSIHRETYNLLKAFFYEWLHCYNCQTLHIFFKRSLFNHRNFPIYFANFSQIYYANVSNLYLNLLIYLCQNKKPFDLSQGEFSLVLFILIGI